MSAVRIADKDEQQENTDGSGDYRLAGASMTRGGWSAGSLIQPREERRLKHRQALVVRHLLRKRANRRGKAGGDLRRCHRVRQWMNVHPDAEQHGAADRQSAQSLPL